MMIVIDVFIIASVLNFGFIVALAIDNHDMKKELSELTWKCETFMAGMMRVTEPAEKEPGI